MDVLWCFESEVFVFVIVCRWPLHATTANVHSMFALHIIVVAILKRWPLITGLAVLYVVSARKWNFRHLSGSELAGNEIFLQHGSIGDWGGFS